MTTRHLAAIVIAAAMLVGCVGSPGSSARPSSTTGPCPTGRIPAGTYLIPPAQSEIAIPLTMALTDGFDACGLSIKGYGDRKGLIMVAFWTVRNVYADPCKWKGGLFDPPVGPTVDDLVRAMADQRLTDASPATDVTLDGFSGKHIRVEVPRSLDTSGCDPDHGTAAFRFWDGPANSQWYLNAVDAPGLIGEAWILDVYGSRVTVQGAYFSDAPPAIQAELHRIVESIDFYP